MKWYGILAAAVVGSAIGGAGTALWINHRQTEDQSLSSGSNLTARLDEARDRIAALDEALADAKKKMATRDDYQRFVQSIPQGASTNDLAALGDRVARLESDAKTAGPAASAKLKLEENGEEKTVGIEEYIDARLAKVQEAASKNARKRQMKDAKPFIKMGMAQEMNRLKTKLNLNEEQTKRLETAMNRAFDKNFTQMEILMDPEKPAAEKQQAAKEIQSTMDEVQQDAQSYLDATQLPLFVEQQQNAMKGMQGMINMQLGGGAGGSPQQPQQN